MYSKFKWVLIKYVRSFICLTFFYGFMVGTNHQKKLPYFYKLDIK